MEPFLKVMRHIFMFLLHTCGTQKHSHRHLYVHSLPKHQCTYLLMHTHPATPTPIYLQLIYKYIHTALYTCAPTATLYTHMNTHRAQLYAHMHKSIFKYAHISQVHPGSHTSPYPVNKTYIYKYMWKHTHVSTSSCLNSQMAYKPTHIMNAQTLVYAP